jgi:16S rRNA (adenine1518-N6/adenine1519-N6)-dimethyltransferase
MKDLETLRPNKALGQHFLSDPSILSRIVELAGVKPGDLVLEIGPGPGGLTKQLSKYGAKIWAVEADLRMVEHLKASEIPNLRVEKGDALRVDYLEIAKEAGGVFKLVANLPYNISGPLTAKLLHERAAFSSMTLMYQKEVAERILAPEGGKTRGSLSVMAQTFCKLKRGFKVPPGAFKPPPKVDSLLLHMDVLPEPAFALKSESLLWDVVNEAFQKRRKQLRNCLRHRLDEPEEVFRAAGLKGDERPETLSVKEWVALVNQMEEDQ